jgi:hypothetical protein
MPVGSEAGRLVERPCSWLPQPRSRCFAAQHEQEHDLRSHDPWSRIRMKYYNNCIFHNVQENFIAQTGDPTGTGRGGDSIWG